MRPFRIAAAFLVLAPLSGAMPGAVPGLIPAAYAADAALEQIIAASAQAPLPAFERVTQDDSEKAEARISIDRFTPQGKNNGIWTLQSVDGRKPTAQEIARHKKENSAENVPGFHRLHEMFREPPTRRTQADGRIVYHWASLPKGAVVTPGGDISEKLSAEMVVETDGYKSWPQRVRIYAAKPFSVKLVAKMHSFNVVSEYRPGKAFPMLTGQTTAVDVSAPMGMGGKTAKRVTFKPL